MEKSIYWLKFARKGATIVASLVMFMSIVLDTIFRFIGITSFVGFQIMASGMLLMAVTFALNIAITLIIDRIRHKENAVANSTASEVTSNNNFFSKFMTFVNKYENVIKLFSYIFAFVLTVYLSYSVLASEHYWDYYYFICIFFWIVFVLGAIELLYAKNKATLITHAVLLGITLILLIWTTVYAHDVHFAIVSMVNLTTMNFLYLALILLLTVISLVIVSDNDIKKVKRTRNFGIGILLMCISICMYYAQPIASFLLKKWGGTTTHLNYFISALDSCTYLTIGLVILAMVNVGANAIHYVKTKNWLGLVDIVASFIAIILCLLGILFFARFVIYI